MLPPTYYCESRVCRDILFEHSAAVEAGFIQFITEYLDLAEYMDRKRTRYTKAARFPHYNEAYFNPKYKLSDMPFQKTPKQDSIGKKALDLWGSKLTENAITISAPLSLLSELRLRAFGTERPAFLWENVLEHIQHLHLEAVATPIRAMKDRCYLTAYSHSGIAVPSGSNLIVDHVVPSTASKQYNIRGWRRLFEMLDLIDIISTIPVQRLLKIKLRPEVAGPISKIRQYFETGMSSDTIIAHLQESGDIKGLISAFK